MIVKSNKEIGKLVRKKRQAEDMGGAELADKAHTSQAMISRIERGKSNVTISTLIKIATAFGKRLDITFK
jgi:transcriptional regulator with XRE-family HTH domain